MLHTRAVVDLEHHESVDLNIRRPGAHLDAVLARGGDDLTRVELERGHGVIVLQRLKYATGAQIPDLSGGKSINSGVLGDGSSTHADGLVQTATDDVQLVELQTRDRSCMSE